MSTVAPSSRVSDPFVAAAGQTDFEAGFPPPAQVGGAYAGIYAELTHTGVTTRLAVVTDFDVIAATDDNFTIRLHAAASAGDGLRIYGEGVESRAATYAAGSLDSAALEAEFTRQSMRLQEHRRDIDRAPQVSFGESGPKIAALAARKGKVAVFDPDTGDMGTGPTIADFNNNVAQTQANAEQVATDTLTVTEARADTLAAAALAGHYANDATDVDVPGGSAGERGARYWANQAMTFAFAISYGNVQVLTRAQQYQALQNLGFTELNQNVLLWGDTLGVSADGVSDRQLFVCQHQTSYGTSLGAGYFQRRADYTGGAADDAHAPVMGAVRGYNQISSTVTYAVEAAGLFVTDNFSYRAQGVGMIAQANAYHGGRGWGAVIEGHELGESFVATAGQTVFTLPNGFNTIGAVTKNGALLTVGTDYTAASPDVTLMVGAADGDDIEIHRADPAQAVMSTEFDIFCGQGPDTSNPVSGNRLVAAFFGYRHDKSPAVDTHIGTGIAIIADPSDADLTIDRGLQFQGQFATAIDFTASNFTASAYLMKINSSGAGITGDGNAMGIGNVGNIGLAGFGSLQVGHTTNGALFRLGDETAWGRIQVSDSVAMLVGTETDHDVIFQRNNAEIARFNSVAFQPAVDNILNNGGASNRWATIYAGTSTINTSDAREKTALRALEDAELRAIKTIISGIGIFQYLNAVAQKGADLARLHVGVTAQQVKAAFEAEGLDAARYAAWCEDAVMEAVETTVTKTVQRQIMDDRQVDEIVVDGDVARVVSRTIKVGRTKDIPVFGKDGNPLMAEQDVIVRDDHGQPVFEIVGLPLGRKGRRVKRETQLLPVTHTVPVMEDVEITATETVMQPMLGPDGTPYLRLGLRENHLFWLALAYLQKELAA